MYPRSTSWTVGLPGLEVKAFAIDPTTPSTLYAGTFDPNDVGGVINSVFMSTDSGTSRTATREKP
jgi:hypothetical protein